MRRSQRAKRLQMIARNQQFEIVAPLRIKNSEVLIFVKDHRWWMLKQSKHPRVAMATNLTWPENFLSGETILFRDQSLKLNVKFGDNPATQLCENALKVVVPWKKIDQDALPLMVKQQIKKWYQLEAMTAIQKSLDHFCPRLGRWPSGVQLKQQKSRWGSCGISDKININWLLILAPQGVLEYVVAHELCHLFHRNHGKRFWAKVENCFPEFEQHERWLSKHGHTLFPFNNL